MWILRQNPSVGRARLISTSFHLVLERLFISGLANRVFPVNPALVSISFLSGFSCQDVVNSVAFSPDGKDTMFPSRNRAAFHVRATQSRMYHPWGTSVCFHLVIERLLISGTVRLADGVRLPRFNLVIERLLISGRPGGKGCHPSPTRVSISLSSGFSFQVGGRGVGEFHHMLVSISLSSGFSFQV